MAIAVTGIEKVSEILNNSLNGRKLFDLLEQRHIDLAHDAEHTGMGLVRSENDNRVRRVKIVHVDIAWDLEHPIMPRDVIFGSTESKKIVEARMRAARDRVEFDPLHGTTCVATLRANQETISRKPHGPLTAEERKFWNYCSFADIILVPIRDEIDTNDSVAREHAVRDYMKWAGFSEQACKIIPPAENDAKAPKDFKLACTRYADEIIDIYNFSQRIVRAFDEVTGLFDGGVLERGDIIVPTIHYQLEENKEHLPIIHSPWVEDSVRKLTHMGLSVIIPAGNSGADLGARYIKRFGNATKKEMEETERKLFRNHGVKCGAVLVGAAAGNVNDRLINHGDCVDVFGRCNVSVPPISALSFGSEIYRHWRGSSIASIAAAAVLGCIQQIRHAMPENILPLKPYEARAHLRQWRSKDHLTFPCFMDLAGPPPNVVDWLEGTAIEYEADAR